MGLSPIVVRILSQGVHPLQLPFLLPDSGQVSLQFPCAGALHPDVPRLGQPVLGLLDLTGCE